MNSILKVVALIFWAAVAISLLGLIPDNIGAWLVRAGGVLLVAHIVEYVVFKSLIKARGDGVVKGLLMTLVFGVIYFNA